MYRPKIILLVDYPNWAFDHIARSIVRQLKHKFDFSIKYFALGDRLDASSVDLIHVFAWGGDYYKKFGFKKEQIIKEVASLRWMHEDAFGCMSPREFAAKYLNDCSCVVTPSLLILELINKHVEKVFHMPNGVESTFFYPPEKRRNSRRLTVGWVGNPKDSTKGLFDILVPATENHRFLYSNGHMSRYQLARFYQQLDVLAVASLAEGQPLPLLESMASGCFPVVTNVGIVPEIVSNGENGLVVARDVESFKKAFDWCAENLSEIRQAGERNRLVACTRSWERCARRAEDVYRYAYEMKIGRATGRISSVYAFPSCDNSVSRDDGRERVSILQRFSNCRLIVSERWSRFWLGDPIAPGCSVVLKSSLSRFYRKIVKRKG